MRTIFSVFVHVYISLPEAFLYLKANLTEHKILGPRFLSLAISHMLLYFP